MWASRAERELKLMFFKNSAKKQKTIEGARFFTSSDLVVIPRNKVDGEGVLIILTGDNSSLTHMVAATTFAAPVVLQKVVFQHTCTDNHRLSYLQG